MSRMQLSEKTFLTTLFDALEEKNLAYAVLRDAQSLPDTFGGSDIDMQIGVGKMADVTCCLEKAAAQCGGRIMAKVDSPHFRQLEFLGYSGGDWWGGCIDLFEGIFCQSVLPITDDDLLSKRIRSRRGIWTIDADRGMYLSFVKELVTNGKCSKRHKKGAKRAIRDGKDDFLLNGTLREHVRKILCGASRNAKMFCFFWRVAMALRHPVTFCCNWLGFQLSRFKRLLHPPGRMIAVLGTDGAGKSTVLNRILPVLKSMTNGNITLHHLKPDLLPPLGRFRGVKYGPGHVCTNPHGSKPSGTIGSLVRISYLMCDYIIGYWLKIRMWLVKAPAGLWVFDRYAYDMLIDPRRFRISLPTWIIRLFIFCAPRPDLMICLGGDPATLYARKPETSLDEVKRQVAALMDFSSNRKKTVWIDTSGPIQASVCATMKAILECL